MIVKIKCHFVILELIGQPYCDLEQNNSKNVCLINCFRIDSLLKLIFERYDHTSVNATLLLCGLLHNRDTIVAYYASWEAISHSKPVSNGYISNHNKR